jgi:DNA replication and repair protein RecF
VRFQHLRVQSLRCLDQLDIELAPGVNVFIGANGAGKTSVLEAAFLLSHGRSFRSNARDALTQRDARAMSVFAELIHGDAQLLRLGLGREAGRWQARLDGDNATIGQLVRQCAVVCFEPGSHALIAGGAEERRRYLDWGVFHVEHDFLHAWRRYQRALKQRNALLRQPFEAAPALYEPWETELAATSSAIDTYRREYLARLLPELQACLHRFLPELGASTLHYRRGWAEETDLAELLQASRGKDRARGHTSAGVHRADWSLGFVQAPLREHLSRGQEKLTALACLLAQAQVYRHCRGEWPVMCLDDLASELDQAHQQAVVEQLLGDGAQVLVSGTELPQALKGANVRMFHVEQGRVSPLL